MGKYAVCYVIGDLKNTVEEPRLLLDVIEDYDRGLYHHTDYYCALFDNKEEACRAYKAYLNSHGEDTELIESHEYSFVCALTEDDDK